SSQTRAPSVSFAKTRSRKKNPAHRSEAFPSVAMTASALEHAAAGDGVVDEQHDHRADDGDEDAVEVQAGDAGGAEAGEHEAADEGADDAQQQVEPEPAAGYVHELAGDEAGDQAQNDPGENRHQIYLQ